MKKALLATVAVAALAMGGYATAQEHGGSRSPSAQSAAPGGETMKGGAEKSEKSETSGPRSAQSEPNHGAAQSGHETGAQHAQEQHPASGPDHDTGRARAEDRKPEQNRTGANETSHDNSKSQAQDNKSSPSTHTGAADSDKSRKEAQDNKSPSNKRTGANESEHRGSTSQAQQPSSSSSQRSGSNDPSMSKQPDRTGANEQRNGASDKSSDTASSHGNGGDVNVTGSIKVEPQKASRVHDELIRSGKSENVNISVNVGTVLPERVRPRPLPASIISISPEFRGYDYVVVEDEIVIVEPKTRKVVTIIQGKGGSHHARRASFTLNSTQKSRIRSDIEMGKAHNFDVEVSEGRVVPGSVVLEPLPEMIVREVPEVREYRYFVDDRRIVIVDPDTREVVDIIQ